jgi:hypothetical protein
VKARVCCSYHIFFVHLFNKILSSELILILTQCVQKLHSGHNCKEKQRRHHLPPDKYGSCEKGSSVPAVLSDWTIYSHTHQPEFANLQNHLLSCRLQLLTNKNVRIKNYNFTCYLY